VVYVEEARQRGLTVLPPCVNRAGAGFRPVKGGIMAGLSFIRNLPFRTAERIVEQRKQGAFSGPEDLILRCGIREKEFLVLAKSGALDCFAPGRRELILSAGRVKQIKRLTPAGEKLPGMETRCVLPSGRLSLRETVSFEIDSLGFSVTASPLELLSKKRDTVPSAEMARYAGKRIGMQGIRIFSRRIPSRKGNGGFMKFISFLDEHGTFEAFLPPDRFSRLAGKSLASPFLRVYGRVEEQYGACTLFIEKMEPLFPDK
jgi:DNA polymerase III alpha subunit